MAVSAQGPIKLVHLDSLARKGGTTVLLTYPYHVPKTSGSCSIYMCRPYDPHAFDALVPTENLTLCE